MTHERDCDQNFSGLVKSVISDYPYPLHTYFNDAKPNEPLSDLQNQVYTLFKSVFSDLIRQHGLIKNTVYSRDGVGYIDLKYLDHYLILCHRFANQIFRSGLHQEVADAVYYSSRIRTSSDFFYRTEIGECFMPVHPIGTLIDSHAIYGKGLKIYNGVHIGPNKAFGIKPSEMTHPQFGDGVILLANSTIYGNTKIGNNVIVSARSVIIDEEIPSNCIVMGESPNLKALPNKHNNLGLFNFD